MMCKQIAIALVASVFLVLEASAAVSVIPNASGYGMTTPAGRGGEVFRVTNLDFDGDGSLKACIDATGPRVCVFEVSGAIELSKTVSIVNPNITIAGQTAPSPGIMLHGNMLRVAASDVLIQHIRIRLGDGTDVVNPDHAGAGLISNNSAEVANVVLDHVSLSWGIDENMTVYKALGNVTIRNSIISEALHDSLHSKGPHSMGGIVSEYTTNVSLISNLFAHNNARNPRVLAKNFVFVNNIVYNYGNRGLDMSLPSSGDGLMHSVVGNLFISGTDSKSSKPISLRSLAATNSAADSKIYLSGNAMAGAEINSQWDLVDNRLASTPSVAAPPNWPSGLEAVSIDQELFLSQVGARPADRDSVDLRVIRDVKDRTGSIINCVSDDGSERCARNAGGWPKLAQNQRRLSLPENPHSDDNGNGYTNMEEWLHAMAAEVEGRATNADTVQPKPPKAVGVN